MLTPRLRIAWFSDLSKGRPESLSAYCSRRLLPELSKQHSIEIFSESFAKEEYDLPHHHYLNAYQRHREVPFDVFFYQLEDGPHARFVRGHIGLVPGVVWVHDLFCRDLGPEACHTSPWERSIRQFYDPSLPFSDRATAPHQLWPRVFRESSLCPVVLFSSAWARAEFSRMTSTRLEAVEGGHSAEVLEVPVLIGSRSHRASSELTVALAAVPGIEGRAHKLLPVLRTQKTPCKLLWMVSDHERPEAEQLIREFGLKEGSVEIRSSSSPVLWEQIVSESDVAVHTHTSTFGHLGPYVQISLASGCPTIVERSAQGEDLPDSVVFKVVPGLDESAQLREIFEILSAPERERCGELARIFARKGFAPETIATKLSGILSEAAPHVSYVMDKWRGLQTRARHALLEEVRVLVGGAPDSLVDPYESIIAPAIKDLGWAST